MRNTVIKWVDSVLYNGWQNKFEIKKILNTVEPPVKTKGYIVGESKDYVLIASSVDKDGNYSQVIKIPKCSILNSKHKQKKR